MKGYVILTMLVSLVALALPPMMLREQSVHESDVQPQASTIAVRHTDEDTYSDIDIKSLALYETAAQIAWDAPGEAIKAQAIACYTLLCYQQNNTGTIETTCLSYPTEYTEDHWKARLGTDYEKAMGVYREVFAQVDGKQIVYEDQPIMALSHAVNSGITEDGEVLLGQPLPYLISVASPADAVSADAWKTITFAKAEGSERLRGVLGDTPSVDMSVWFGQSEKTSAGTVKRIQVCGQPHTGYAVQNAFALPSPLFDVTITEEQLVFSVRGRGHCVGMSVCGAIAMANDGQLCEQILKHYYSGTSVQ